MAGVNTYEKFLTDYRPEDIYLKSLRDNLKSHTSFL
jgi:hypothetical protein